MKIRYYFLLIFLVTTAFSQKYKLSTYSLTEKKTLHKDNILGNDIGDILTKDSLVWVGTGSGLNKTIDGGNTWNSFTRANFGGKSSTIISFTQMNDSIFWLSTGYDTLVNGEHLDVGGGLSYTKDYGLSWVHIPQPKDNSDITEYRPTTTAVQNITWDMAALYSTIWITSWGGGLRKSSDMGLTWEVVTTDGDTFDVSSVTNPLNWKNHIAFSVMVENGNIWVGTADGISKSTDGGISWERYTHTNQDNTISGNWVIAFGYQEAANTIWAVTWPTGSESEFYAVSKSADGGNNWDVVLSNIKATNFAFDDDKIYITTVEGVYVSEDGENWNLIPPIKDSQTGEELLTSEYYAAGISVQEDIKTLWLGSGDGLASTMDDGNNWTVHRDYSPTQLISGLKTYAYPTPFSPSRDEYLRFQYNIPEAGEVVIDIYDFAMDKVAMIIEYESMPIGSSLNRSAKWNGKNYRGDIVASGVYFYRVKIRDKVKWGKLVVIN